MTQDNRDFYLLTGFLILLFTIAPLYFQANMGGRGLGLSFNLTTWAAATTLICYAMFLVAARKFVRLPQKSLYFIAAPVIIILTNIITGSSQPDVFLFRELFLVGGLLFFFALFQFHPRQAQVETILLAVSLSTIIHSTIGILQIFYPEVFGTWFATAGDDVPRGVFQQINVQVTFLTTGIIISIYLLSRPIAKRFSTITLGLLILSTGLGSFVVIYSGSRVGLLSLVVSLLLLLIFRRKQLLQNKLLVLCAIIAISSGTLLGKGGMERSLAKTANIAQGENRVARINMYRIALELIAQEPIHGHGIGNFLRVWNLQASDYISRNPDATLPSYVDHPHNELVYWLIEGGLVIVSGILAAIFAVLTGLIRCGPQRATGYIAMLLPITLHTQVELPFYISSLHWFLWLFLVFVIMRHGTYKKNLPLSNAANRLIQLTSIVIFVTSIYFLHHTSRALTDIMNYVTQKPVDTPYLEVALHNSYHRRFAEELAMRGLLYKGITADNRSYVAEYIQWSAKPLAREPKLIFFRDLVRAFTFLDDHESKCKIVKLGLEMYAHSKPLRELNQSCIK
jgi:O-antigen polymerase